MPGYDDFDTRDRYISWDGSEFISETCMQGLSSEHRIMHKTVPC